MSKRSWQREIMGGVCGRGLLNIQIIFLHGFESVQGQVVVRLTEHSDLPQLRPLTLTSQTCRAQCSASVAGHVHHLFMMSLILSDLVISESLVSSLVSFCVCCYARDSKRDQRGNKRRRDQICACKESLFLLPPTSKNFIGSSHDVIFNSNLYHH